MIIAGALATTGVRADAIVSGPPCVVDGNTIQVGGKTKDGTCWGGIPIRLYGSLAPKPGETCTNKSGKVWPCGQQATVAISKIIRAREIACYHLDGEFDGHVPFATCISGRTDVAEEMVLQGFGKTFKGSDRYKLQQKEAQRVRRGLWR